MERQNRLYIRNFRYLVQWGLFSFIVYGGWKFHRFVEYFSGQGGPVERPGVVEGFLPIGALMSLKVWIVDGVINKTHPAALFIFVAALAVSAVFMKGFCGWICPIGALSELLYKAGGRIFGRNFRIHKYMDYPLRSLKYILMGLFLWVVFIKMDSAAISGFMSTPYWKVADVKMLSFFTDISLTAGIVMGALVVFSLLFRNFWCRYLCPYGALTGLLGLVSPVKISRSEEKCINCHKCTRDCPNLINVEDSLRVRSPECSGCMTCVAVCPARGALEASLPRRLRVRPLVYACGVLAVFFGIILAAQLTGHWKSDVTFEEYRYHIPRAGTYVHP